MWALAAYVIWLVVLVVYAAAYLDKIEALYAPDPIADTDGTVWLLVGSDSRDGLTKKQQKKLRTGVSRASGPTRSCWCTRSSARRPPWSRSRVTPG